MRLLTLISTLFLTGSVFGQQLVATISKNRAKIGEPLTLKYTVKTRSNDTIVFFEKYGEIPIRTYGGGQLTTDGVSAEIYTDFNNSTSKIPTGKKWEGTYEVMIWDSGTFIIPGPEIIINDATFRYKDLKVYVDFSAKQKGIDIYDIRENYAELPEEENVFVRWVKRNWWILAIVVVAAAGLIWFINKRKPKEPVKVVKAMSLKERTLMAIDALEGERLWEQDKLKEHFIELSYIMRSYLTARYNIAILEKTTFQTKKLLLQKGLHEDTVDTIGRILSHSDMVKFAKSSPDEMSILKISTLARQIVAETSPLEFDNYE
ncbi:MAG: hypothetical protein DCO96_10990 [Fluviicola sp. XM-24bin1]|nr:MAG: hypothetical protein DCO96_10990 [Fluviicola sp. XM-24bin1]